MNRLARFIFIPVLLFVPKTLEAQNRKLLADASQIRVVCLNLTRINEKYIINSKEEFYKEFNDKYSPHPNCFSFEYPEIDFDRRTLVGYKYMFEGCKPPELFVKVFTESDFFIYEVSFKQHGNCRALYEGIKWFSIPKTTSDKIKFEFKKIE